MLRQASGRLKMDKNMTNRIVFQVMDGDRNLVATLCSNDSVTTPFAEEVFDAHLTALDCKAGPSALVERLLSMRHAAGEGTRPNGERIFWLVPADEADHSDAETVVSVIHVGIAEHLAFTQGQAPAKWHKSRWKSKPVTVEGDEMGKGGLDQTPAKTGEKVAFPNEKKAHKNQLGIIIARWVIAISVVLIFASVYFKAA